MLDKPIEADSGPIAHLIEEAGVFTDQDVQCVRELLDEYLHMPDQGGYEFLVYRQEGQVVGMACYGATPLTTGTFDLYWLAVAPQARRGGVARQLVNEVFTQVRQAGGRLLVLETSGTPEYRPARRFYLATGFHRQATIPDFYAPEDDMIIYCKRFDS